MPRSSRFCFTLISVLLPAGIIAEGDSVHLEPTDEFSVGNADVAPRQIVQLFAQVIPHRPAFFNGFVLKPSRPQGVRQVFLLPILF